MKKHICGDCGNPVYKKQYKENENHKYYCYFHFNGTHYTTCHKLDGFLVIPFDKLTNPSLPIDKTPHNSTFELFKGDRVEAKNLDDFLNRYYKPDRYKGQDNDNWGDLIPVGKKYSDVVRESHQQDLDLYGIDWISSHDSVTGRIVSWYPREN